MTATAGAFRQEIISPFHMIYHAAWLSAHNIHPLVDPKTVDGCVHWVRRSLQTLIIQQANDGDNDDDLHRGDGVETPMSLEAVISNVRALAVDRTLNVATNQQIRSKVQSAWDACTW